MDILKKTLAPITEEAWDEINDRSEQILKSNLTARRFVEVDGPHGWSFSGINEGRLDVKKEGKSDHISYGIRKLKPLIEPRALFTLDVWELDNISRGNEKPDIENLETAAGKIAAFEERILYYGLESAGIQGLHDATAHEVQKCPGKAEEILHKISEGISVLKEASIAGPYALVVNPKKWLEISSQSKGYPLKRHLQEILDGEIIFGPHVDHLFLVSTGNGYYKLTLGVDHSIGYDHHDAREVTLYFTESFSFQVIEPKAVVVYE